MDPIRRNILATGVAAAATAAAPHVFAQQADQRGAFKFYEKGNVRIRYQEVGNGFPFLVTPGGGLNSRISNWQTAVINPMEEFKNDFRCIAMDQRNATGGESTGPIPVDNPWDAFADDQLGLMDHLGIRQFVFFGNCIGGSFALKLMERAPERVVAGVLSQPIGETGKEGAKRGHGRMHASLEPGLLTEGLERREVFTPRSTAVQVAQPTGIPQREISSLVVFMRPT